MKFAHPRQAKTVADERRIEAIESRAERAAAGDTDAMADLFEAFHDPTYRYVYAQVRDHHLAEDLNGKAWLKIVHKIDTYSRQSGAGFPSWVYSIVKNTILDEYRAAHRKREVLTGDMLSGGGVTGYISQDATPEESVLEAERVQDLRADLVAALESLPAKQREVVILRFWGGLEVADVASVTQMTPANVRTLQSRGMRALKKLLPERVVLSVALHTTQEKVMTDAQATATQR